MMYLYGHVRPWCICMAMHDHGVFVWSCMTMVYLCGHAWPWCICMECICMVMYDHSLYLYGHCRNLYDHDVHFMVMYDNGIYLYDQGLYLHVHAWPRCTSVGSGWTLLWPCITMVYMSICRAQNHANMLYALNNSGNGIRKSISQGDTVHTWITFLSESFSLI